MGPITLAPGLSIPGETHPADHHVLALLPRHLVCLDDQLPSV